LPSGLAGGGERENELDRGGPSEPHPNPFCGRTTFEFELSEEVPVRAAVYDLRGRRVKVLADGSFPAGRYELSWNGKDSGGRACPSGIYIIHSLLGTTSHRKKVNYIR